MARQFWRDRFDCRGALLHEFPLFDARLTPIVPGYRLIQRWTDAVILPDWPERIELRLNSRGRFADEVAVVADPGQRRAWKEALTGSRVVVVQAKESVLGPAVLGQAVLSAAALAVWEPFLLETVALATAANAELKAAFRQLPDLADIVDVETAEGATAPGAPRRLTIEALLRACAEFEGVVLTNAELPYRQRREPHHPHTEIEDWYLRARHPASSGDRIHRPFIYGEGQRLPLAVVRSDERSVVTVHSQRNPDGAMMTLPLLGQALTARSLLTNAGTTGSVDTVILCDRINGALLPMLTPFPWVEVVERSTGRRGSAVQLLS